MASATSGPPVARLRIIIVAEVKISKPVNIEWIAGPLEMKWREGTPKEVLSNIDGRSYYLNEGLKQCLYYRQNSAVRWHKWIDSPLPNSLPGVADAIELLALPDLHGNTSEYGLVVVHIRAENLSVSETQEMVYTVTNLNRGHGIFMREMINELLENTAELSANSRRIPCVSFLVPHGKLPKVYTAQTFATTTATQQWLYILANQARIPPSAELLDQASRSDIAISDDYSGRTTPGGISLVATYSNEGPGHTEVHEAIEFFARGLYTDLLLFGMSQTVLLNKLSTQATYALESNATVDTLNQMRGSLLWYRRLYLRSDFAPQPPYDQMLKRYDDDVELSLSMSRVEKDVDDLAAHVQSALTQQTNAFLGLITVVGLPLTIAISIWQVVSRSNVLNLLIAIGLATIVALILLFATNARHLLKDLNIGRRGR